MPRPPFDPGAMARRKAADEESGRRRKGSETPLSVSALAGLIDGALRDGLPVALRVIGQVSGFRDRTHWYFDLKDAEAVINCVMFAGAARRTGFLPENGQDVVVRGRVEFYAKQGRASLLVDRIEPVGAGAMELAFRALCEEIRALGWFAPERKRPLPAFPRRVAVITSRTGAALQDVLDTMRRRCAAVGVVLLDVRVQGDHASAEIADAIRWVGARHVEFGVDAVIVTRGGGSTEDLWAFNERIVAEAIVRCPIPVVAAIGHETDTTIAELVADERAATPTQAAMRLTPDQGALDEQLDSLGTRLRAQLRRLAAYERQRLAGASRHPFFTDPTALVRRGREAAAAAAASLQGAQRVRVRAAGHRLGLLASRLECFRPAAVHAGLALRLRESEVRLGAAIEERTCAIDLDQIGARLSRAWCCLKENRQIRLRGVERQLAGVGPGSVLRRGFSYTLREDGRVVRGVTDVRDGDVVETRLADGSFRSVVGVDGAPAAGSNGELRTPTYPSLPPLLTVPRRASRPRHGDGVAPKDQMDLFTRPG